MKKTISPPENWQDFESLCKKLFGEIWGCPMTIKKNGRLGQPQSGVDVYGKPKNQSEYWGIQCKGKDNYLEAKLTEKEIEEEIEKARSFEPKLKTFIITTTSPKDVRIEKFVRIKDQENCANNSFDIVLYCWQDLVDLIEENRDTFNWYVNEIQFKDKFDIEINICSENDDEILKPKYLKKTRKYIFDSQVFSLRLYNQPNPYWLKPIEFGGRFGPKQTNHGWVKIKASIKNTGSVVLEDWKLWFEFIENTRDLDDDFTNDIFVSKEELNNRTTWLYEDTKEILYKPLNNHPLIQKDSKSFECFCIPNYESKSIRIKWHFLARDFDREGEFDFKVESEYELINERIIVGTEVEVRTETVIEDYITND